jgi:hypothetical protein
MSARRTTRALNWTRATKLIPDSALQENPKTAQEGNPNYLMQTVDSMHAHEMPLDQIYIHHGKEEDYPIFEQLTDKYSLGGKPTFQLVPRDTHPIDMSYTVSRPNNERIAEASKDGQMRKGWRIQEARDFMWTMQPCDYTDLIQ